MAGTVVTTEETNGPIQKVKFACTTSASTGAADATSTKALCGVLKRVIIVPGAAGVQPTDQFDLTLLDGDSVDVLLGNGANLSNANTTVIMESSLGAIDNDVLTLGITNAGNSKTCTVIVYVGA